MGKILLVDDNTHNRYIARFLLEHAGHNVVEAKSGREAILCSQRNRFDLVLMDIQMPGMDGMEATRQIKQAVKNPPPVVAVTAKAMSGDREFILSAGCDGYIRKPYEPEEFVGYIDQYMSH